MSNAENVVELRPAVLDPYQPSLYCAGCRQEIREDDRVLWEPARHGKGTWMYHDRCWVDRR